MRRRPLTILVAAVAILNTLAGSSLRAAQRSAVGTTPPQSGAAASTTAAVTGQTLTPDRAPAPFFRLRLRDLDNGIVVGQTSSDRTGQFSFLLAGGGMFVAEVLGKAGEVLAVGEVLTVQPGEAVGIVMIVPLPSKSLAAFFGNTAAAIVQAAAGAGITAVTSGTPISREK